MEKFRQYIKTLPDFSAEEFTLIKPFLREIKLDKNKHFLQTEQICRDIAFIEKGIMRIYYITEEGKEITSCFCKENNFVTSYQSLIAKQKSAFSIQALEPTTLTVLSYEKLELLFKKSIFWQQAGRLIMGTEYLRSECHNRFLDELSAKERYLKIMKDEKYLLQRVSLKHLASYLQITPESLSRIRKEV